MPTSLPSRKILEPPRGFEKVLKSELRLKTQDVVLDVRAADLHGHEWGLEGYLEPSEWMRHSRFEASLQTPYTTTSGNGPWNVGMDEGIPVPGPELGGQFE